MSHWLPYLEFATALAAECAQYAVTQFRLSQPWRKADGTLVTKTDEAIDRLISSRIHAAYPDHLVLSEEQSTRYNANVEYTWVVDPVDGTTNFARGLPVWGVSVALLCGGAPVVGVVDFPVVGERFTACTGCGAWRSGEAIHTAAATEVDDEQILMKCTRTDRHFRIQTPLKARILGSAAYHLCKVADGTALAGIEATPKVWDLAAAYLVVVEAGGLVQTWSQTPIFPLAAISREYGGVSTPIFSAANASIMNHLVNHAVPHRA